MTACLIIPSPQIPPEWRSGETYLVALLAGRTTLTFQRLPHMLVRTTPPGRTGILPLPGPARSLLKQETSVGRVDYL